MIVCTAPRRKALRQRVQTHSDGTREYWRDIPGYEGLYRVSDRGRVKSLARVVPTKNGRTYAVRGKVLQPRKDFSGRLIVFPSGNGRQLGFFVHRLVLLAFVGPCPEGMEACHNDGNPSNNRLENLRWDTHKNNERDKVRHGTFRQGESLPQARLTKKDIPLIYQMDLQGITQKEIARHFGIRLGTVSAVVRGETWKHIPHPDPEARIRLNRERRYKNHHGERNGRAKLTEEDVREIRKFYNTGLYTTRLLARKYGVSPSTVQAIIRGDQWKHVLEIDKVIMWACRQSAKGARK